MPDVLMPRLSDTMEEGVLSQWLKAEGDEVHKGDILAEIETDKATMEMEAYDEGILERRLVDEGATVPIGQPVAVIGSGTSTGTGEQQAAPEQAAPEQRAEPDREQPRPAPGQPDQPAAPPAGSETAHPAPPAAPGTPAPTDTTTQPRVRTSPLARRIARDHGIDLATVTGTGPGGRILRVDVEAAVAAAEGRAEEPTPTPRPAPAPPAGAPQVRAPSTRPAPVSAPTSAPAEDEEIPLTAVRRVTARRLTESATAPHFYLTSVVDADRLLDFRAEINDRLAATGTRISVTDLLVRACAVTLREYPQVNSSWGEDKILRHRRIHVGVAVALDDGLIVPVVRDTDRKSLGEIAAETRALAERARAGRLTPDEFTGGTFTISNLGMYGIDHFTAVINPPEAAILAVGAATEEPVLRDGQVVGRRIIKLTLSIDHRVVDGATAAEFLRGLRDVLEEPYRIVV